MSPRHIPKNTLETIRARVDIVELIGSYLPLKRAGSTYKALCPFHNEKTPSFTVNAQRQIFHCFGCGAGGDVFSFIMQREGMDFAGAATLLARQAGVEIEEEPEEPGGISKNVLFNLNEAAAAFYRRALLESATAAPARAYLAERGLSPEIVESFQIGYAPNRWDAVLRGAQKKGWTPEQLEAAGLVLQSSKPQSRNRFYDRFRDRLMFPIADEQGRIAGFSGRSLKPDEKSAKYINTPETALFRKSRILYGLHRARRSIADGREALICEGQIDVLRCHQEGLATAVACQGTAFTEEHARILRRYADGICLAFDSDKAGQEAAVRAARVFFQAGLAVRVADLPEGEDADSYIRKQGLSAFRERLQQAKTAIAFQFDLLSRIDNKNDQAGRSRITRSLLETALPAPEGVQRDTLVHEIAYQMNLDESMLKSRLNALARRSERSEFSLDERRAAKEKAEGRKQRVREEMALCELVLQAEEAPAIVRLVERYLPLSMLSDPDCRAVMQAALESVREERPVQEILYSHPDASGDLGAFYSGLLLAPAKVKGDEVSCEDAVKDLILCLWRKKLKQERYGLSGPDAAERLTQITYDLHHLKRWADGAGIIEIEMASGEDPLAAAQDPRDD